MTTAHMRATVVLAELETLGLTVEDLLSAAGRKVGPRPSVPSFSAYLPAARGATRPPHLQVLLERGRGAHGTLPLA